jgi:ribosomal protein L14
VARCAAAACLDVEERARRLAQRGYCSRALHLSECNNEDVCSASQVAAGSVQKAVIVETKKGINRADGSKLRFDRNACVLVSDKGEQLAEL